METAQAAVRRPALRFRPGECETGLDPALPSNTKTDDSGADNEVTVHAFRQYIQNALLVPSIQTFTAPFDADAHPPQVIQVADPATTICQRRDWHNLQLAVKVAALRAAGYEVAVGVAIRLLHTDNTSGYAVADYIATLPDSHVYQIGEVKTGNAVLTGPQRRNYQTGAIQIIGNGGLPVGLAPGVIVAAVYLGVDRFPGCPKN